jgi:LmbE family N-acetylglucosaminyl deacetylase
MERVSLLEIVRVVESLHNSCLQDVVYTHHHGDLNVDHCLTYQAVLTACRTQPGSKVKENFRVLGPIEHWMKHNRNTHNHTEPLC